MEPASQTKKTKKGKPKMFLLFLFVTTFIWFLTKFSREITASQDAKIIYSNIPHGIIVSEKSHDIVSYDLTASGFDFLYYKINKPVINIDIKNYYKNNKSSIVISNNDFKRIITSQLKNDITVKNVSIETMEVFFDKLKTKKVKISLLENIKYKKGFKSIRGIKLTPDSIDISGPTQQIDTLNEINTELVHLKDVSENVVKTVNLQTYKGSSISYSKPSVDLEIIVKEFTQKTMSIPIVIKNLPKEVAIKLMPKNATITFDVSMEEFNKIIASDFKIVCDYDKKNDQENFMIPHLASQPESIMNIEFQENKINYLIFK